MARLRDLSRRPARSRICRTTTGRLEAVRAVLQVVGRDGVYDVQIVEAPQARAGLYGRAILLISLPALPGTRYGRVRRRCRP